MASVIRLKLDNFFFLQEYHLRIKTPMISARVNPAETPTPMWIAVLIVSPESLISSAHVEIFVPLLLWRVTSVCVSEPFLSVVRVLGEAVVESPWAV